ncbi:MAG: MaoC/PaaZ C-terminal domain-containing protein, partial [SAR324 cluster bacterium]|nr:MaoC/PaaZ C-terminal domain-containing protein [SAR324 cluster bacterium]
MITEPITRHALAMYCGASGDHNPIHVDFDYAKEAGLDDVIAHGMLSMGYLGKMLTKWIPQKQIRSYQARFIAMTHIGETVSCSGRIANKWEEEGKWLARIELFAETPQSQT